MCYLKKTFYLDALLSAKITYLIDIDNGRYVHIKKNVISKTGHYKMETDNEQDTNYIPLEFWFSSYRRDPPPENIWVYDRYISNGNYYENCLEQMMLIYLKWLFEDGKRWDEEKFNNISEEYMCTDWNKDFDNEFWTSTEEQIRENAFELSGTKSRHDLYNLPFPDEVILFAICSMCNLRRDELKYVEQFCKDAKQKAELYLSLKEPQVITLQRWFRSILYHPRNMSYIKKMRKGEWSD